MVVCTALLGGGLCGQIPPVAHNFEVDSMGLLPASGYKTGDYLAGPALHAGYEFHWLPPFGVEIGGANAWLPAIGCNAHYCTTVTQTFHLVDYGLRGRLPLRGGRVDLSLGIGGGYIWYPYGDAYTNGSLLQYSAKATIALDRGGHWRLAFALRAWRDLVHPTQQWLTPTAGMIFGFGQVR